MYCPNCHRLFEEDLCPECGAMGRYPKEDDYCLLGRFDSMWAQMLADLLQQNGIESLSASAEGAAMRAFMGTTLGQDDLYVLYRQLQEADALKEALFHAEIIEEDQQEAPPDGEEA